MPQRFLRPGLRNSERWNSVSWTAQSLFVRLLTLVDDYGRYDGRPSVIWGECFAVWNQLNPDGTVPLEAAADLIAELQREEMLECYTVNGKPVIQITQWQERIRAGSRPKWGANPSQNDGLQQVAASCCELLPPSPPSSPSPTPSSSPSIPARCADATELALESKEQDSAKPISQHAQFIRVWCSEYQQVWGHKYDVKGSDVKQLQTFLKSHATTSAEELVSTAKQAWEYYKANARFTNATIRKATSIASFCSCYCDIQVALTASKLSPTQPNGAASVFSLQKERDRIETQIQGIQAEIQSYDFMNTPEKREQLKALKAKVADLEAKIAKAL